MPDRITSAHFQQPPEARVIQGDALAVLRTLEAESVHCVVSSPPYWGLRDYGLTPAVWDADPECSHEWGMEQTGRVTGGAARPADNKFPGGPVPDSQEVRAFCLKCGAWRGSLGLEPSPALYVEHIVQIFREVRRVLRSDGTLFLNIGDSYVAGPTGHQDISRANGKAADMFAKGGRYRVDNLRKDAARAREWGGLKPKDKCMIPARVAIALQDDGWYLRQEIVWCKKAPMPESTRDRPTTAHEMVYLFAKSGDTTYYTHPHKPGVRGEVPPPDYRWHDHATGERTAIEPEGWRTELLEDGKTKRWRRINLWEGHDYFYDQEAERVPYEYGSGGQQRAALRGTFDYADADVKVRHVGNGHSGLGRTGYDGTGRNLWSYWLLSPDPYSEAHFAVYPRELARRCISLGTSAYGCCAECGAPWARVVERVGDGVRKEVDRGFPGNPQASGGASWLPVEYADKGWAPTCTHYTIERTETAQPPWFYDSSDAKALAARAKYEAEGGSLDDYRGKTEITGPPVQPCMVLDPFSGAGTTGVVAVGLGRRYLGIELSAEYVRMSERRIAQTQPALPGLAV